MRDYGLEKVSEVVFEQTFTLGRHLLADDNSTSSSKSIPQTTRFNPSMAIIIIVLISAFLFMGFFSIYVRRCTSPDDRSSGANGGAQGQGARPGQQAAAVPGAHGLDKAVVENLPLVGFTLVKGLKGGKDMSECAVCLSDFEDDDNLRVLPKCGHMFHQECIDVWFTSHSTCPLCRASVASESGKEGEVGLTHESHAGHDLESDEQPIALPVVVQEAVTVHGRPPVPPNGSILELLSQDGADSLMVQSLRRGNSLQLDRRLSRREENGPVERSGELRALNRALSKNSTSMRIASRGLEASNSVGGGRPVDSGRLNAAIAASAAALLASTAESNNGNEAHTDRRERKTARSVGSSRSFNFALRRSSSVGSSGRYIRQLFGNHTDHFSSDLEQDALRSDRTKGLGTDHRLPIVNPAVRRERSETELDKIEAPVWETIDLNEGSAQAKAPVIPRSPNSARSADGGVRSLNYPGSAGRKYLSGEFPTGAKSVDLQGQLSGPLYTRRKVKETGVESTKSERFSFGQSFRRTFSLRRTSSDAATESSSQQSNHNDSIKWWSPLVGAMKGKRAGAVSSTADVLPTPPSSVDASFPQSLPILSDQSQQHQQQSTSSSTYPESIQIVSQP